MSGPYQDILKDSSQSFENGDYFLVTILDLELGTQYPLEFRWKYKDGTFGKDWSAVRYITTPGGTVPEEPQLLTTDVVAEPGIIKVTWSGKGASNQTLQNLDRVNIHIAGVSFGDGTKPAGFFKEAGTQTFTVEAGTYLVQLKSVTVNGLTSFFSESRTVVVPAIEELIEAPVTPTGFSARPILGGIEVTWNGSYSGSATWSGFQAVNIYAGTSAALTGGTYTKVGQMTANKTENKIVIPIDGTYVKYGSVAYIHASSLNKATPPVESSISANVANATPSRVVNTDLIDEVITAAKIALGAITEVKIDTNAITAAKIAANAVTETKIATDAVTSPKIVAGAITAGKIATGAITADKIEANAITADKIAANSITAGKILAGEITAEKLAALTITSDKIAANAIVAGKVAANAVTVDLLGAGSVSASTYIRVGTKNLTTGAGARIEIAGGAIEDGNVDIVSGLHIYNSGGAAIFSAPLSGGLSITGSLTATTIGTSSGKFSVNSSGIMNAQDATFTGTITASAGAIGGIRIFASSIQNNTNEANSTFKLDSAGLARFGATSGNSLILNPVSSSGSNIIYHSTDGGATASGKFSVTAGGILTAVGGNFSGTITNGSDYWNSDGSFRLGGTNGITKGTSNSITLGSDVTISGDLTAKSINIDSDNYWNNTGNAGRFRVGGATKYIYWNGSTIDVSGKITADSGAIGGWTIHPDGYLYNSSATTTLYPSDATSIYALITTREISADNGYQTRFGNAIEGNGTSTNNSWRCLGDFEPESDNLWELGASGRRWIRLYAVNSTINTSDYRIKKDIEDSSLGLDFINRLRPVSYKYKVGNKTPVRDNDGVYVKDENGNVLYEERPGIRTHWGLIAQEVKEAVDASGVEDFAGWVKDDMSDPDSMQSLSYDQFISPIIKALQEISDKVNQLSERLDALEG